MLAEEKHEGGNDEGARNGLLRVSMGDGVNCTVSRLMARNVRKRCPETRLYRLVPLIEPFKSATFAPPFIRHPRDDLPPPSLPAFFIIRAFHTWTASARIQTNFSYADLIKRDLVLFVQVVEGRGEVFLECFSSAAVWLIGRRASEHLWPASSVTRRLVRRGRYHSRDGGNLLSEKFQV